MVNAIIFLVAMFLLYNYLLFELIDTFLRKPRLKKTFRIPVGIINVVFATAFTMLSGSTSFAAYIAVGAILFVEFVIFYKDKRICSLFCMLACIVHVMAVRALCVAGFALAMNSTIYDIANTPFLLATTTGVTFMFLNIVTFAVIKIIPAESIRIINQHNEQIRFMVAWLSVFGVYLLINSKAYSMPNGHQALLINKIVAPGTILIGIYIVLYFSIKTVELLGYKEKQRN